MSKQPECPECEKLAKVSVESNKIGDFMDWLSGEGYTLALWGDNDTLYPARASDEQLLAKYFGIDLNQVEYERRALLEWLREVQEST